VQTREDLAKNIPGLLLSKQHEFYDMCYMLHIVSIMYYSLTVTHIIAITIATSHHSHSCPHSYTHCFIITLTVLQKDAVPTLHSTGSERSTTMHAGKLTTSP
jgi:hypothetical protein